MTAETLVFELVDAIPSTSEPPPSMAATVNELE
jgi:hypothetical protein